MNADERDRLAAYDDEKLDRGERAELERLLDTDPEAREFLAQLRRDKEQFIEAFATVTAKPGFTDTVLAKLPRRHTWLPLPRVMEVCAAALLLFVLVSVATPFRQGERQRQLKCQQEVKDLALAAMMYAEDYDQRLPDAKTWLVQLRDRRYPQLPTVCPSDDRGVAPSYAMPIGIGGADVRSLPSDQVLWYDADGMFPAPRHEDQANVGRLDGSVVLTHGDSLVGQR